MHVVVRHVSEHAKDDNSSVERGREIDEGKNLHVSHAIVTERIVGTEGDQA